jgi:outer membrane protein, heavy metal efflux system
MKETVRRGKRLRKRAGTVDTTHTLFRRAPVASDFFALGQEIEPMAPLRPRWLSVALGLLLLSGGCCSPMGQKIDDVVCDVAAHPVDLQPLPADQAPIPQPLPDTGVKPASYEEPVMPRKADAPPTVLKGDRLQIPDALLPGGPIPRIQLPADENDPKRKEVLDQLYPAMPATGDNVQPALGPEGRPLNLADLQRLALSNSPLFRQAAANVEAMRGTAVQAGAYPNPTFGFENDTAGTAGGPGYIGGFLNQVIKTGNKLQLQRAAATMDLRNAELALKRAKTDLTHTVRGQYYQVLVAQENVRVSRALADFTSAVYDIQVKNVRKGGFAAPYEPMQLRVLAWQAQAALVQARNRYTGAWKQLAAAMGLPGMHPTELAGRIDAPIPVYDHAAVLARALQSHTDVLSAENTLTQARFRLKLAQVQVVPDVTVNVVLQKDYTGPPFGTVYSLQAGVPVPIFDRNQGGILQAQSQLVQSSEESHRVRDDLTTRLAIAFEAYENNRVLLRIYRDKILPDQVRAYRAIYDRYQKEAQPALPPGVPVSATPAFSDVVVAQQNLAQSIATYVQTLGAMWQAVADVADLLQTDDLFQLGFAGACPEKVDVPDLANLPGLTCLHSCSPLPDPQLKKGHGDWPAAAPELDNPATTSPIERQSPAKPLP